MRKINKINLLLPHLVSLCRFEVLRANFEIGSYPSYEARGRGGGGVCVACLNFKRSRVPTGVLSMFHIAVTVAVGNLKKGCCLSRFHFKC